MRFIFKKALDFDWIYYDHDVSTKNWFVRKNDVVSETVMETSA